MSTLKTGTIENNTGTGAPVFKNNAGTEIGQLVKVWVNFDGSGTVAIRDDFNVASLTDNGTGDYTIAFGTALANNDYALVTNQRLDTNGGAPNIVHTGNEHHRFLIVDTGPDFRRRPAPAQAVFDLQA